MNEVRPLSVAEIYKLKPTCLFLIKGQIQWLESKRPTKTRGGALRYLREAKFLDETGDIDIAV